MNGRLRTYATLRSAAPFVLLVTLSSESRAAAPSAPPPAPPPDCDGAYALTADIRRIVAGEEGEGWFSDAHAFRSMDEHVLESVCRATPDARARALSGLRAERARAGDARELHRNAGELTDAVERALTADRELRALERALARAESECPFWVEAEPGFAGLQSDRERITLNLETGGYAQLRETEDDWTFGGGGMGRLLVGWGFDGRTTLLFGPELGGGAMIRPGTSASQFVINYFPALPLVLRNHGLTWHWSTEAAAVALFQADDTRISFGGRIGGAFGLTALRTRNVLPWAGLAIDYEYYPRGGGRAPAHFLRGGLRFGFPWDP
ncbi:MAG TPA: hypothetical protein VFZ53_13895 [Polyangiaceae bacterium]